MKHALRAVLAVACTVSTTRCPRYDTYYHAQKNRPTITAYWSDQPKPTHPEQLSSSYLEEWAIFDRYEPTLLQKYQLPHHITRRNRDGTTVPRNNITRALNSAVSYIQNGKALSKKGRSRIPGVSIVKDQDFNYRDQTGLLVVRILDPYGTPYPFIAKLFMENPQTFVRPFRKGFVPMTWFYMGGGINRYLAGFTRIPNKEKLKRTFENNPDWAHAVTFPRKWFWTPPRVRWFTVESKHMGPHKNRSKTFPNVYAIIADYIELKRQFNMKNPADRKTALDIGTLANHNLDIHTPNFGIEKDTHKIAIIDTEHLASGVGIRKEMHYNSFTAYFAKLAGKCIKDVFFTSRKERQDRQNQKPPTTLNVFDYA